MRPPARRYEVAGCVVETALPLPEAREAGADGVDWVVELVAPDPALGADTAEWLTVEHLEGRLVLRFSGLARFAVSAAGDHVSCVAAPGVPAETLAHLLLDHVIPRLLSARGLMVVHASAVLTPFGAVGFCGDTGAGKSTLAASFAAAGAPVLADDALVIDETATGPEARATYPGIRLWGEGAAAVFGGGVTGMPVAHYTDKRRLGPLDLAATAFTAGRAPVVRVYVLGAAGRGEPSVVIAPMTAQEAFLALSRQVFRLDAADRTRSEQAFERLSRSPLLRLCRVLRHPHDHARLADVRAAILADLAVPSPG